MKGHSKALQDLIGGPVYDMNGEEVGELDDVLVADSGAFATIDFGGRFNTEGRLFALAVKYLEVTKDEKVRLTIAVDQESLTTAASAAELAEPDELPEEFTSGFFLVQEKMQWPFVN